ncbi:hypothetical protein BD309DRAFT_439490 [Dichomitus squalens]|nr:hypothetical protein BD309DRAFT_439490 [Dichomitus squalens]
MLPFSSRALDLRAVFAFAALSAYMRASPPLFTISPSLQSFVQGEAVSEADIRLFLKRRPASVVSKLSGSLTQVAADHPKAQVQHLCRQSTSTLPIPALQ